MVTKEINLKEFSKHKIDPLTKFTKDKDVFSNLFANLPNRRVEISDVFVSKTLMEEINKAFKLYAKKVLKVNEKQMLRLYGGHRLCYDPCVASNEGLSNEHIYVRKKKKA